MKKKRIKSLICFNCLHSLKVEDNFCPNCGQENDNKRRTFGKVMMDFFEGFVSVDSRLANSIPLLLFRPGFLTRQYLDGKRNRYLDPVKMFITIVVIYFLVSSVGENVSFNKQDKLDNGKLIINSEVQLPDTVNNQVNTENHLDIEGLPYREIQGLISRGRTDTGEVLDSLGIEKTFWNRVWYGEVIKFAQSDFEHFRTYLVSKLPWVFFLLMPVFALLLKLLYIRRKILYYDHLIFAFHLHSFVFLLGIFYALITKFTAWDPVQIVNGVIILYILLAMKRLYIQPWGKTILKFSLLSILYFFSTMFSLLLSMIIIFFIY